MAPVLRAAACAGLAVLLAGPAAAGVPERFRVQLTVPAVAGAPLQDGTYSVRADVHGQESGGPGPIYSETDPAEVLAGRLTLTLEPATPGDLFAAFGDLPVYLEVTLLSGPGLSGTEIVLPRREIGEVPFALLASETELARELDPPPPPALFVQKAANQVIQKVPPEFPNADELNGPQDIVDLVGIDLPSTTGVDTREFRVSAVVPVQDALFGTPNAVTIQVHNGSNGDRDDAVAASATTSFGEDTASLVVAIPSFRLRPADPGHTKVGLVIFCEQDCVISAGQHATWLQIEEVNVP